MNEARLVVLVAAVLLGASLEWAQDMASPTARFVPSAPDRGALTKASDYVLGPDDQITVRALHLDEIPADPIRIGSDGYVTLPLIGRVQAAGLTPVELEKRIAVGLKEYVREPDVTVTSVEQRSQPVSVLGSVGRPGIYQLQGGRTLSEVLALCEGLRADAGHKIVITRTERSGPLPLANTVVDATSHVSVGSVEVKNIIGSRSAQDNILIHAHDVISVPRAELVYVLGEVRKPGGFILNENESMSVLQALSLSEGLSITASPGSARILRSSSMEASRQEIPVDVRKILRGKGHDVSLRADDILFIPKNAARGAFLRAVEASVQMGTGVVIWRR